MREVHVWPAVHNRLWQTLSKECYDDVCKRLFDQLENNLERWRKKRHPADETIFVYTLVAADGENWHTFEFHADDTTADTCVLVVDVFHSAGKTRIN